MIHTMWPAGVRAFRRAAPPLAWYYLVALALPLANGAAHAGAPFLEHAVAVLVVPPILIVFVCAVRDIAGFGLRLRPMSRMDRRLRLTDERPGSGH